MVQMNILSRKPKTDDIELKSIEHHEVEMLRELREMKRALLNQASLKTKFLQGMASGFGTVVGATLIVALFIFILNQVAEVQILEPLVQRVIEIVNKTN
jgi:ABC-type methionine transport system permease subunit